MASTILTPEQRAQLEAQVAKAEPYDEDDPITNMPHHPDFDNARMSALIAKMLLEGKL